MITARTFWGVALFLVVAASGCSVTVTPAPATCSADSTVTGCTGGASGFSCTGAVTPDQTDASLFCSDGVITGADTIYCCVQFASTVTTTCAADSTVTGCSHSSIGFSCTGTDTPDQADPSLNCSTGTAGNAGATLFCCQPPGTSTATCAADSSVTGCVGGASGFSCAGGDTPDQSNNALICSDGVPGAGATAGETIYCCVQFASTVTTTCAADTTVTGCTGASIGFSCTGTDTPEQADASLNCSTGTAGNAGSTLFCCQPSGTSTTGTCAADSTVAGCVGSASGYSCTGTDTPSQSNNALNCSTGVAGNAGSTLYCCVTFATATSCAADTHVQGCAAGSIGFSCSGGDTPEVGDPSLTCSVGVAGSGATAGDTIYCCATAAVGSGDTCAQDATVTCATSGASGYSCKGAAVPDTTSLICSEPTLTSTGANFCCLTNSTGVLTCAQDQAVVCTTPGSYGFSCDSTTTPAQEHTGLTCSAGVAGPNSTTQYCCQ